MKVYFASDHAGFQTKNALVAFVRDQLKYDVEDCGALVSDPQDDYPAIIAVAARKLSQDVAAGKDSRAIVAGASGQGEAIVANRFKGVRCADAVARWLAAPFGGEARHARRITQIDQVPP